MSQNWMLLVILLLSAMLIVISFIAYTLWQRLNRPSLSFHKSPLSLPSSTKISEADLRFREKADEAMRLNQTFQKFVPKQFVDHFAKHGSKSLELGRADEDEMAILFCDIRGFTGLSERMSPQELMNFLNSYFLRMNDPIHQNNGFIDKFIGDAIMALFDHPDGNNKDKAVDAIKAALDLRSAIDLYNLHRSKVGYSAINIGVGIHFGPVIIGTVGSDDRMDTTVIGDTVNIAYRLESLAPVYHADILVSAQLLNTAKVQGCFNFRLLDWVRVKGRTKPIEIYEILDHLPPEIQQQKLTIAPLIQKGIQARIRQDWQQALAYFRQAQQISPKDKLVQHHLYQCSQVQATHPSSDWDGAINQ